MKNLVQSHVTHDHFFHLVWVICPSLGFPWRGRWVEWQIFNCFAYRASTVCEVEPKLLPGGSILAHLANGNQVCFQSWSCSELIRGAAAVVDAMDGMTTEQQVAQQKRDLLSETSGMETGQLEALLQDSVAEPLILSIFMPAELNARPWWHTIPQVSYAVLPHVSSAVLNALQGWTVH